MSQNNQNSNAPLNEGKEISLIDILLFLRGSWKIITILGAIGLAAAIIYLLAIPKQYQAIAQIQMAQISAGNSTNLLGPRINIEEPALLIARMSLPTAYTPELITKCDLDEKENARSILAKSIKLSQIRGVNSVVELKITAESPTKAHHCANAIFELVNNSQDKIVSLYIEEAKIKLEDYQSRLVKAKDLALKAEKSGAITSDVYHITRDEHSHLLHEIAKLQNVIESNINRSTRLLSPIYVSEKSVSLKKQVALTAGLISGLFFGILIALGLQNITKLRTRPNNKVQEG